MFEKYKVLTARETVSRFEIYTERYCKDINTESLVVLQVAKQSILPAAYRYQGELAATAASLVQAGHKAVHTGSLEAVSSLVNQLEKTIVHLEHVMEHKAEGDILAHARYYRDAVLPAMLEIRKVADALEVIVADDIWPLPKYSEMLFIK